MNNTSDKAYSLPDNDNNIKLSLLTDQSKHWLKRIWPIIMQYKTLSLSVTVFAIGAIFFQVVMPALLGRSIDALNASLNTNNADVLTTALTLLIGAGVIRGVMNFFVRYTLFKLTYEVEADIRSMIYRHLSTLAVPFFDRMRAGQIIARANSDVRAIQSFLLYIPYIVMVFGTFVLSVVYMVVVNIPLALVAVASLPFVFLLSLRLRKLMFPISWLMQSRVADVAALVDENIHCQSSVKVFAQEQQQIKLLQLFAMKLRWVTVSMIKSRAKYSPLIENTAVLSQILVLLYGGWLVINEKILLGQLVAFNFYVLMMLIPFRTLGQVLVMGRRATAAAKRIFEILDEPGEDISAGTMLDASKVGESIRFEKVSHVTKEPKSDVERKQYQLFDSLDLTIKGGMVTGIVGKIGSGKSTIANMLVGFTKPNAGKITIADMNINDIQPKNLRQNIMLLPQEAVLFAASIEENIRYGCPDASLDDVIEAAKLAQAHEFIENLPDGYGSMLEEKGANLSGGQRQRINIAQAILFNASILIVDDATSALDGMTEKQIIQSLKRFFADRTIILISHRASMLEHTDEVAFLYEGKILCQDSHQNLLTAEPLYQEIFAQGEQNNRDEEVFESDEDYYRRIGNSSRDAGIKVDVGEAI